MLPYSRKVSSFEYKNRSTAYLLGLEAHSKSQILLRLGTFFENVPRASAAINDEKGRGGEGGVKSLEIDHFARKALGAGHYSGRGAGSAGT